jgi:hypothetical protein
MRGSVESREQKDFSMGKGPTYEELKERVEALEAECIRHKWTDQAPREIETRYRTIVENTREGRVHLLLTDVVLGKE